MKSILFVADGSPRSMTAANVAISIAGKFNRPLLAQFVIDPHSVFDLEGYEGVPGLCGSGVFIQTELEIIATLINLGESLLMSFAARAEGQGVAVEQFVDVGNTASEINERAKLCELIILSKNSSPKWSNEELAKNADCAVLAVESETEVVLVQPQNFDQELMREIHSHLTAIGVSFDDPKSMDSTVIALPSSDNPPRAFFGAA